MNDGGSKNHDLEQEVARLRHEVGELKRQAALRSLLGSNGDLAFVIGVDGRFTDYCRGPGKKDLHPPGDVALHEHFRAVFSRPLADLLEAAIKKVDASKEPQQMEYELIVRGKRQWYRAQVSAIDDASRQLHGTVVVAKNITKQRKVGVAAESPSCRDPLTGLAGRTLFHERLRAALKQTRSYLALLLINVDDLKSLNERCGHPVGDRVLRELGDRLTGLLRRTDTVSRMGSDEFMVLIPDLKRREHAGTVAQKVLDCLTRPWVVDGTEVELCVSMGLAIYPDDGLDFGALRKNAAVAMSRSRQDGRSSYRRYAL